MIVSSSSASPFVIVLAEPAPPVVAAVPISILIQYPAVKTSSVSGLKVITLPVTSTPQSVAEAVKEIISSVYVAEEHTPLFPSPTSKLATASGATVKSEEKVKEMVSAPPVCIPVGETN